MFVLADHSYKETSIGRCSEGSVDVDQGGYWPNENNLSIIDGVKPPAVKKAAPA
jgi:hypothetical protein